MLIVRVSPQPSPLWGGVVVSLQPLAAMIWMRFSGFAATPTSVGFGHSCGHPLTWIWLARPHGRARQKPLSSLTRQTGSHTGGFKNSFAFSHVSARVVVADGPPVALTPR